ncbi:MAG: radical SAM protein, partial [Candidatus Aenigmatarchaeota archaeon]
MSESKRNRIENWLNGIEEPIWNMQLQPTDRCNLKCQFCWRREYTREFDELSKNKWLSIVKDACEMGVKLLTFVGGGEPLLRKDV